MNAFMRFGIAVCLGAGFASASLAFTASNTVPPSRSGSQSRAATLADSTPSECSGLVLAQLVNGSGSFSGTAGADLMLGSSGLDQPKGGSGNDCLVGGGGVDDLDGGSGTNDICIGGPGIDTFKNCEVTYQ